MIRYSFNVVAPTICNSPRAKAGFKILPASILPSPAAPAPTISWTSSMKRMIFSAWRISSISFCIRSSNCPRIPVPCTREATSKRMTSLSINFWGTSPSTIFWAKPSTTAVLPTPGSPIRTGLFFVRRFNISITRWISSSRPTTGSIFPSRANPVILIPYSPNSPPPFPRGGWLLIPFPPPNWVGGVWSAAPCRCCICCDIERNRSSKLPKPKGSFPAICGAPPAWFFNFW